MVLDPRIKKAGDLATTAFQYLNKLQTGEKPIVKTGQIFIDTHLQGVLPSDVILYAGNSGTGKTKLLYDTLDTILDENVNKNALNFCTLQYELEMKFLNKILRDTSRITDKKKSKVLTEEFSEHDKDLVRRYYEGLKDNRRFICEDTITSDDFLKMTDDFCAMNTDKDAIWVTLDHCLLVKKSSNMEDTAEVITSHINTLRKKYHNVYFILLSQFNRMSMTNIKDRDNSMLPTTAMIYGSSHFEFLSSFIVVIVDPFKLGVNSYLKVNADRYDWLSEFM
jgi:replicative DNA helicase